MAGAPIFVNVDIRQTCPSVACTLEEGYFCIDHERRYGGVANAKAVHGALCCSGLAMDGCFSGVMIWKEPPFIGLVV